MALADCSSPPPLLPPALSSAQWWGVQWPAGPGDLGRFWGRGPAPRELAWLALGLLVWLPPCGFLVPWPSRWPSTRMPSLRSPRRAVGHPAWPPGAEEPRLLEIGRLERRAGSVGVEVASLGVLGRPMLQPDPRSFVHVTWGWGAAGLCQRVLCVRAIAPRMAGVHVCVHVFAHTCVHMCVCGLKGLFLPQCPTPSQSPHSAWMGGWPEHPCPHPVCLHWLPLAMCVLLRKAGAHCGPTEYPSSCPRVLQTFLWGPGCACVCVCVCM